MSKRLGRYGTYPRRPNTDLDKYDDSSKDCAKFKTKIKKIRDIRLNSQ